MIELDHGKLFQGDRNHDPQGSLRRIKVLRGLEFLPESSKILIMIFKGRSSRIVLKALVEIFEDS